MTITSLHKVGIGYGEGNNKAFLAVRKALDSCIDKTCLKRAVVVVSGDMSFEEAINVAKYVQDCVGDETKLAVNLSHKGESEKCTAYVLTFIEESENHCEKDVRVRHESDEIVDAITSTVCSNFGVDFCCLVSDHNAPEFQMPRELILYFCREFTEMNLEEIGSVTRDEHVAVMAAISQITHLIKNKENLFTFIKYLEQEIFDKCNDVAEIKMVIDLAERINQDD